MLSCYDDAECDPKASPIPPSQTCGSTKWAIAYFCTFIFLCMFFVSIACFFYQLISFLHNYLDFEERCAPIGLGFLTLSIAVQRTI